MKFVDLKAQQMKIRDLIDRNIQNVLDSGNYILGPEVKSLEDKLAKYVGTKHAIACSSGTDALLLSLMAHDVGPGDALFTTPFTFIATSEVISLLGATPVFVDIDEETLNISANQLRVAIDALSGNDVKKHPVARNGFSGKLTPKGIISVDIFGLTADYDQLSQIAEENGLFLIEDGAQSFGSEYNNRRACSFGNIGCTSFFPAKPFGCYGDGGMCFTNDDNIEDTLRSLLAHGKGRHKYDNARIGINGRLDTIQAAILHAKFEIFPEEVTLRQAVARRYITKLGNASHLKTQKIPAKCRSVWAQFSVLASSEQERNIMMDRLKNRNIPTAVYYPKPLHLQTAFLGLGYRDGDFPVSEEVSRKIFSLPMHPYLREDEQDFVVRAIAA